MTKLIITLVAILGLTLSFATSAEAAASVAAPDHASGKITAIHPAKHSFVLSRPNGNKVLVRVTQHTKIRVDGQPATFADLAVGQRARAIGKFGPNHHALVAKRVRAKN